MRVWEGGPWPGRIPAGRRGLGESRMQVDLEKHWIGIEEGVTMIFLNSETRQEAQKDSIEECFTRNDFHYKNVLKS